MFGYFCFAFQKLIFMRKFTKEQALEELKKQIPTNGNKLNLSDRSINEQLETLMPLLAGEDTELTDFIGKVLPVFRTADANVRNDVSVGIKDYKEKNPPVTVQKGETTKTEGQETDNDVSQEMKSLLDRIAELEKKNLEAEKNSLISRRRSDIISKMSEKGCKDKDWISSLLDEVNLEGDNFDATERAEKYLKMYNKGKSNTPSSITPETSFVTSEELNKEVNDFIKQASQMVKSQSLAE